MKINVGRKHSGGVLNGLFGNPIHEREVSEQYRMYFRKLMETHPHQVDWLKVQLLAGDVLYCPGCGTTSSTCHARIIEQELQIK